MGPILGAIASPLDTLLNSLIGWIIEHVAFTNFALDTTTGDPENLSAATAQLFAVAASLDQVAADQTTAFKTELTEYFDGWSPSAEQTHGAVQPRAEQIRGASLASVGLAEGMTWAGALCSTLRGLLRDALVTFVRFLLRKIYPR